MIKITVEKTDNVITKYTAKGHADNPNICGAVTFIQQHYFNEVSNVLGDHIREEHGAPGDFMFYVKPVTSYIPYLANISIFFIRGLQSLTYTYGEDVDVTIRAYKKDTDSCREVIELNNE